MKHITDKTQISKLNIGQVKSHMSDLEHVTHRSQEIPGVGTYKCQKCGETISISQNEQLPLCPICNHNEFTKVK